MTDTRTSPADLDTLLSDSEPILNRSGRVAHSRCCLLEGEPFRPFTAMCGTHITRPTNSSSRCQVCIDLDKSPDCPNGGLCVYE
jgi:hypothetical protein